MKQIGNLSLLSGRHSILLYLLLGVSLAIPQTGFSQQTVFGKWKTIDENTNKVRSIIDIYERKGSVFGKLVEIFPEPHENPDPICNACPPDDPRYKKRFIGMEIMKDLKKSGQEYSGGHILDPKEGKIYRCKIWLEGNRLKVRGYWGPFYRTQTWERASS